MANIVVLAGHNSIVPGAAGNGYQEHIVARSIKDAVIRYLKQLGHNVLDATDEKGTTKEEVWMNAVKRANAAFGSNCIIISIHLNSGGGTGVEVFDFKGTSNPLAANVSRELSAALGLKNRGQKDGSGLGIINSTQGTCILVECAFIDNAGDMAALMKSHDRVAAAIVKGTTGQTVSGGGSTPPPQTKYTKIYTGGYGPESIEEVCRALTSVKMTSTMRLGSDGMIFFTTEPTSDAQFKAFEEYLQRNKYWYEKQ